MKLVANRIETGVPLPATLFTTDLKEEINRCVELNLSIDTLHDRYRKLQQNIKSRSPKFNIAAWYAWIDDQSRTLNIRFGESGDPQIIVQEVAE
jgi:hypothetical protein